MIAGLFVVPLLMLRLVLFGFSANAMIGFALQGLTLAWFARLAADGEF